MTGGAHRATRLLGWDATTKQLIWQGALAANNAADGPLVTIISSPENSGAFITALEELLPPAIGGDAASSSEASHMASLHLHDPGFYLLSPPRVHPEAVAQGSTPAAFRVAVIILSPDMLSESPTSANTPAWCHLLAMAHMLSSQLILALDTDLASHPASNILLNLVASAARLAGSLEPKITPPSLVVVEHQPQDAAPVTLGKQLSAWSRLVQDASDPCQPDLLALLEALFQLHQSSVHLPPAPPPVHALPHPKPGALTSSFTMKVHLPRCETTRKSITASPQDHTPCKQLPGRNSPEQGAHDPPDHSPHGDDKDGDNGTPYTAAIEQHLLVHIKPRPGKMLDGHRLQPEHDVPLIQAYLRLVQQQPKKDAALSPAPVEDSKKGHGGLLKSLLATPRKPGAKVLPLGPVPSVQQVWTEMLESACAASAQACLQEYKERMAQVVQVRDSLARIHAHQVQWTAVRRRYLDSTTHMDGQAAASAFRELREDCDLHFQSLQEAARNAPEEDRRGSLSNVKDLRAHRMSMAGGQRPNSRWGGRLNTAAATSDAGEPDTCLSSGDAARPTQRLASMLSQASGALPSLVHGASLDGGLDLDRSSIASSHAPLVVNTNSRSRTSTDLLPESIRSQVEQSQNLKNAKRSFSFLPYVNVTPSFKSSQSSDDVATLNSPPSSYTQLPRLPLSPLATQMRRQRTTGDSGGEPASSDPRFHRSSTSIL